MTKYINLHTHSFLNDSSILEIVNQYTWEFNELIPNYSIGIHPWFIDEIRLESDLRILKEKLLDKKCLALGECGLDKRIAIPMTIQIEIFKKQIALVQQTNKPIILHCVAAFDELIAIKKTLKIENPMIIHGFSKNLQVAKTLFQHGFYISFGKYLFKNEDMEKVITFAPENKIFIETDTLDMPISEVYEKAAFLRKISVETLKEQIYNNYNTIFISNIS